MSPRLLRFGQVLMLLSLWAGSGGHWLALQSVAWTRMLVSNAQEGHLVTAVVRTFDGRHPCALCQQIARGRSSESSPTRDVEVENQATFVPPALFALVRNEGISWNLEIPEWHGTVRAQEPTPPPPRGRVA